MGRGWRRQGGEGKVDVMFFCEVPGVSHRVLPERADSGHLFHGCCDAKVTDGLRPPPHHFGTPVGARGARSGGLGGREPPRKARPPELCYLADLVAGCNTQNM